ncbi:NACHT, LRR and PYD domains-containing protein 12-like isoform X1 [Myxocyprinus asiaticus]|uniref:NACHT, LRR and PYD domains-containing protein 12-like isoform X1 n=1 Tax=Myxocyprinus asiaticus TaxID=70543 RepID=UPI00222323D8|nr:NACHT, LRR and PYD domains-containing protein 12-like isoform X1 [Myxocyprinus asiaticus]XP_051517277.1 NACHT, LRR and PYD domains-containing protein 12-like isoform X1 [Myxocyprinus asiaticus]XP_051517278.1 NACHT, LRR and PYD domains-containing protein 12-like isoform X1 [Myxocyprinus asiaticus]
MFLLKSASSMLEPIDFKKDLPSTVSRFGKQIKPNYLSNESEASLTDPISFNFEDFGTDERYHKNNILDAAVHSNSAMECQQEYKSRLKAKYQCFHNGLSSHTYPTLLNDMYTELYITEGESENINKEHEVRQIETLLKRQTTVDIPVKCNDIFKHLPDNNKPIKCVLTKGVAGIGKTVSVQKFILDWAEGKTNQYIESVHPLPFRELNLMKGRRFSLVELLQHFKMEAVFKDVHHNVLFIFDGLDECRFPLDFQNNEKLCNPTVPASIDVLLTNLINKTLLPGALLWITSRPAAASQIPREYIDLVTEVRGFNDPQKEEYLNKRINDKRLSGQIITHLKSSRSLYIMCHIPVFCWLSVTVLERMFNEAEDGEIPKTLTQMYTHFLLNQTRAKNMRYSKDYKPGLMDEDMILKLGKLAFQQLKKGNLIFYEEDLMACDIDVQEAVVYSGVCSQIFREESALTQNKVYCFVHLSIQEFLAAMYVYFMFKINHCNVLDQEQHDTTDLNETTLFELHKSAIDKALQSENGHLDLFLRFLLGVSLESNQRLLQGLLPQAGSRASQSIEETVEYIKKMIEETALPEKSINLFYCLNELNELSLVKEVQRFLNSGHFSKLSPAQWSALVFVLLTSEEKLDVFDLKKYIRSDEGLTRLLPVVKVSESVLLDNCGLSMRCCRALASTVSYNSSNVRVIDLCSNSIGDKGLELLSAGMKNSQCKLEELRLSYCRITTQGCSVLESELLPNLPNLRVLDLSENSLRESGIRILANYLRNQQCTLEILRLKDCRVTPAGSFAIASALQSNPSHLRELDLHWNNPGDNGVEKLSAVLEHPLSKLETLWLSYGLLTDKSCEALASALRSSFSTLKALDLSGNAIHDKGVKMLSNGLGSQHCKISILRLALCEITEVGVADLASALVSNPDPLRELDLRQNHIKDAGVTRLSEVVENSSCRLETLRLGDSGITKKGCAVLAAALNSNTSNLKELDLSKNDLADTGLKLLSPVLRNHSSKIMKLDLSQCALTMDCCDSLASIFGEKSSSLRELDLGVNNLQDLGVKILCAGLVNPHCQLETLRLSNCGVTGEGCTILASALSSNHSLLREMDLSENNLTDSAVRPLSVLLDNPHCKLEKINLY